MSKSKQKFVEEAEDMLEDLVGEGSDIEDGYDGRAIYPIFNKETKKYEYMFMYIDETNRKVVKTEIVPTKFEHEYQIEHDIAKYFADFFTKKKKI